MLAEVMRDEGAPAAARVAAANSILDRGWGRAPQSLDVPHRMTLAEEFEAFVRGLRNGSDAKVVEASDGGGNDD